MKFRRLVIECGVFATAISTVSIPTAVSVSAAEITETPKTEVVEEESDSSVVEVTEEVVEDTDWSNQLIVDIDEKSSLNVRKEASKESKIVGKMYAGSGAEVVEKGDEWTKIKSGDVEGYVKNEYCLYGDEAKAYALEKCELVATSTVNGLRVRSEANTDCTVLKALNKDQSMTVDQDAEEVDGWIAVKYGTVTAYVSAEYVEVELGIEEAKTLSQVSASSGSSISSSSSDVTLLAALIMCEAGGEPYAGKLAVGAVVVNRVKSSSFPNSISGVIYQSGQFSPARSGKLSRVLNSGNISGSCYEAARAALAGQDNTGGCKYFHAGTSGRGTVIGSQIFY